MARPRLGWSCWTLALLTGILAQSHGVSAQVDLQIVKVEGLNAPPWLKDWLKSLDKNGNGLSKDEVTTFIEEDCKNPATPPPTTAAPTPAPWRRRQLNPGRRRLNPDRRRRLNPKRRRGPARRRFTHRRRRRTDTTAAPTPAPTPAPPNICGTDVELKFKKDGLPSPWPGENNLGGFGPDKGGPKHIRYSRVGDVNQGRWKPFDVLVSTTSDSYKTPAPQYNGLFGLFGHLTMATGSRLDLKLQFVEYNTTTPLVLPKFFLSFFDIDTGDGGQSVETVMVKGWEEYYLSADSELLKKKNGNGYTSFIATKPGTAGDNPNDPLQLSEQQARRTVSFMFLDTSEVWVSIEVGRSSTSVGRDIYFAGNSSIVKEKCSPAPSRRRTRRRRTDTTDAPTPAPTPTPMREVWQCSVCSNIYIAEEHGDGKPFEELPDSWKCPVCGQPKSMYRKTMVPADPEAPAPPSPTPAPTPAPPQYQEPQWVCNVCSNVYDPSQEGGLKFEQLPADWLCPVCGAPKSAYQKI